MTESPAPPWVVGARYKATDEIPLRLRLEKESEQTGVIQKHDTVLLLALLPVADDITYIHTHGNDEINGNQLMAYLADTRTYPISDTRDTTWISGWGQIRTRAGQALLGCTAAHKMSWEVGGRYSVAGNVVLRAAVELESQQLRWLGEGEEIVILDLGLLLRGSEPKLRARVVTRDGLIGWMTVERPMATHPLLNPLNLLHKDIFYHERVDKGVLGGHCNAA